MNNTTINLSVALIVILLIFAAKYIIAFILLAFIFFLIGLIAKIV